MTMIAAAASQKRSGRPFIIKVNHTAGFTVTLPLVSGAYNYNFIVDWGDGAVGQVTAYNDANRIHTYASGGTYTITMTGTLEGFSGNSIAAYLIEVTQWGRTGLKYMNFYYCTRLLACYGKLNYKPANNSCSGIFDSCLNLTMVDVSEWDVSDVTDFSVCFRNCSKLLTLDVSKWIINTSAPVSLEGIFVGCSLLNGLDVSGWNVSTVTTLTNTFSGCVSVTTLDVSNWNVANVTKFRSTFANCNSVTTLDVSNWDVSKATDFGSMFYRCLKITSLDTSSWVFNSTSNISFSSVFYECPLLTTVGDVSGWNTTKFTTVYELFRYDGKLTVFNPTNWDVSNITSFAFFMDGCASMTSMDLSGWVFNSSSYISFESMFSNCQKITTYGDLSGWNTGKVQSMNNMFWSNHALTTLDLSNWDTTSLTGISMMFYKCRSLTQLDMTDWDVSRCTSFNFYDCGKLTTLGDTSGWNASISSISFDGCSSLQSLDLSGCSVANVTSFGWCFRGCVNLTTIGDVSGWNVGNVTSFTSMFVSCRSLTSLDFSNWNVSKSTNFSSMFSGCYGLTSLDVSGWTLNTTTNVSMLSMFQGCTGLTSLSFTGWNTSKVTNFQQFLDGCTGLTTCDVSVLSTASATNVSYMFRNCLSMTSIDISGWDLSLVTAANMTQYMFAGCYGLTSLTLPLSLSRVDNQFAVFGGSPPAITVYNINRSTAPTVSGTPFGNYAKPLHVPVSNSGYNEAPWTNTAIFSSIIADL